jgi:membrane protein implicated in regulation of membrane protease activity
MTKRSAIVISAALAVALLFAVAGMTLAMSGGAVANAGSQLTPVVQRQVHTVTIHKPAPLSGYSGDGEYGDD